MRDSTVACAPFRSRGDIGQRAELSDTAGVRVDISAAPPAALAGVHRYRHPGPIGTGPGPGWPRVRCWAARRIEIDTGPGTEAPRLVRHHPCRIDRAGRKQPRRPHTQDRGCGTEHRDPVTGRLTQDPGRSCPFAEVPLAERSTVRWFPRRDRGDSRPADRFGRRLPGAVRTTPVNVGELFELLDRRGMSGNDPPATRIVVRPGTGIAHPGCEW